MSDERVSIPQFEVVSCPVCGHGCDKHDGDHGCWEGAVRHTDSGPWFLESAKPYWECFTKPCECTLAFGRYERATEIV